MKLFQTLANIFFGCLFVGTLSAASSVDGFCNGALTEAEQAFTLGLEKMHEYKAMYGKCPKDCSGYDCSQLFHFPLTAKYSVRFEAGTCEPSATIEDSRCQGYSSLYTGGQFQGRLMISQ